MSLAPDLVVADRFRLVRQLGQGGMGSIWLAQHTRLDVPCAVKFILGDAAASAELRARFEREARAAAQLRSPHVVQILDHGVSEYGPYIAMELLEGEDLAHRLKRMGVLSARDVGILATHVGRALGKAHAAGLVHRDLKPGNIFLTRDDDREIAKVLDFGVAKETSLGADSATKTGSLLGTPFYMSPEQARGTRDVDHRSDLWALAVVVFQCLTGRLPFKSDALGDLFVKIIIEPLPVPSELARVPAGFDAWWKRAAARDPAERFQTAKELTDALGVVLGMPEALELGASAATSGAHTAALPGGAVALTPAPGQATPWPPSGAEGSRSALAPGGQVPPSYGPPTPFHSAISVAAAPPLAPAPRAGRALVIAGALGALALGAFGVLGVLVLTRGGSTASQPSARPSDAPASAESPSARAIEAPSPTAPPPAEAPPSATSATSAPAPASGAPLASARVAPAVPPIRAKPVKQGSAPEPTAAPRSKTDFGI